MRLAALLLAAAPWVAAAQPTDFQRAAIERDRQSAEFARPELRNFHAQRDQQHRPPRPDERALEARERDAQSAQGQPVRAVVLDVDREKRRIRLGVKQLQPTSIDEYIAEHKEGDVVTGRVADISGGRAKVELGEGVRASCAVPGEGGQQATASGGDETKADVSSLSSMLASKWKAGVAKGAPAKREPARAGQIRSFRIVRLDPTEKRIELELAG